MAMITRWEPFRDLARLQDEVNRLFDTGGLVRSGESVGWTPACDIYEDEEAVSLKFELAGVDPKDVDVRFENGVLTVKGERKLEKEEKRENYHRVERSYVHPLVLAAGLARRREDPRRDEARRPHDHPPEEARGEAAGHPGQGDVANVGTPAPPRAE